jgi:hypothetical protein
MMIKRTFLGISKTILCGLAFYAGTILGGMIANLTGLPVPSLPEGSNAATLGLYTLVGSFILASVLTFVSRGLSGGFLWRWPALTFLTWMAYSVNTYLEASIISTSQASLFAVVMQFFASLLCGAAVAWLFPPTVKGDSIWVRARAFFIGRSPGQWVWRLLAALVAFPVAYVFFGSLVPSSIIENYRQQRMGLTMPGWGEIIPVQFLRSLLFLLACLPVLITWRKSRLSLFITLGATLFILVGGILLLQAYWYPPVMRLIHSLEILADSFAHAGALVILLVRKDRREAKAKGESQGRREL